MDLVSNECYIEEINPDKSKKFTCIQCNRTFKTELGVKQHVGIKHKSIKRTAPKSENFSRKYQKKAVIIEDLDLNSAPPTPGDWTAAFCEDFLDDDELGYKTFGLDLPVENIVNEKIHSTAISEDNDDTFLRPPRSGSSLSSEAKR